MSQKDFALQVGITRQGLGRIITGKKGVSFPVGMKLLSLMEESALEFIEKSKHVSLQIQADGSVTRVGDK